MAGNLTRSETAEPSFARVFAYLREHLLSGAVRPGDKLLGERDLSARLGVSRPILREALRALSMLGVLEIRHGAGAFVRRPDVSLLGDVFAFTACADGSLVEDVMQARIAIECQAIRLACTRAGRADLETLRDALDGIAATISEPSAGGLADHRFHAAIVSAARSETLSTLYVAIGGLLLRSHRDRRDDVFGTLEGRAYLVGHHRLIFEAVVAGDPVKADATLREHFAIGDLHRRRHLTTPSQTSNEGVGS